MANHHAKTLTIKGYTAVYGILMFLLIATTGLDYLHLGAWNLVLVLVIATVKAALVVWYFMHARISERLVVFAFVIGFVMLFIGFALTLTDYAARVF